jgi:hypothetical protein
MKGMGKKYEEMRDEDKGTKGIKERKKGVKDEEKKEFIPRRISTGFCLFIHNILSSTDLPLCVHFFFLTSCLYVRLLSLLYIHLL